MKFRIYDVHTDETLNIFKAEDVFTAIELAGKWYGADNEDVDVECYKEA